MKSLARLLPNVAHWRFQTAVACTLGYLTFWTTGANRTGETAFFLASLLFLTLRPHHQIPRIVGTVGCALFAISGITEYLGGTASIVALAHFTTGIMILQAYSMQDVKNALLALLLACMLVLTAGAMNVNFFFPVTFFPFLAVFCLCLQSLSREQQLGTSDRFFGQPVLISKGSLAQILIFFVLWLGLFYLVPRGRAIALGPSLVNQRLKGFSQTLRLGEVGSVLENNMVVMRVSPTADFPISGPILRHLKGLLLRGRSFTRYHESSWNRDGYRTFTYPAWSQRGAIPIDKKLIWGRIRLVLDIRLENTDPPVLFLPVSAYALGTVRPFLSADSDGSFAFERRNAGIENYQAHIEVGEPDLSEIPYPSMQSMPLSMEPFLDTSGISPFVQELAREIASGTQTAPQRIERTIRHLQENCEYSLEEPETKIRDPIANFLFANRTGSCEHFASAMTLLLRSMGIPARPVSGFLLKEWNEYGGFFTVRQRDAHAWVEVYWPDLGWVPFDPTPSQVDSEESSLLDRIINLRNLWYQFEGYWFNLVYRFDRRTQEAGFQKMWNSLYDQLPYLMLLGATLIIAFLATTLRSRKRNADIGRSEYHWIPAWFTNWESSLPVPRRASETPREYLYRLLSDVPGCPSLPTDINLVVDAVRQSLVDRTTSKPIPEACREPLTRLREAAVKKAERNR